MPLYIKRPQVSQIVEADQITAGSQAHVQGARPARPGEYVVTDHSTGQQWVMDSTEFETTYMPLAVPGHLLAEGATTAQMMPRAMTYRGDFEPEADVTPQEPPYPYAGDQGPLEQDMSDALPGRPPSTPEDRPRLGQDPTVKSPTGLPQQPGDADKAYQESLENEPEPDTDIDGTPRQPA